MHGDTILKKHTSASLFHSLPHLDEGSMSIRKHQIVANGTLFKAAKQAGLDRFVRLESLWTYVPPVGGLIPAGKDENRYGLPLAAFACGPSCTIPTPQNCPQSDRFTP